MRELKIKKGYVLIIAPNATKNLCKNCFFHNRDRENVDKTAPGCLRSKFMACPSTLGKLENGKNMIYKLTKIKEAQNA